MRIILVYLVICIILTLLLKKDVSKQEKVSNLLLMTFLPVVGCFLVFLLHFTRNNLSKELKEDEHVKQIVLFTDRMDKNKDTNMIPIEESLIVNDTKEKRSQILEILKTDASDYIDILNIALNDIDRETAHYAATALSEIKRNLDIEMQKFDVQYSRKKTDTLFLKNYEQVLDEYLSSKLVDENILNKYRYVHISVLKEIINNFYENTVYFTKLINELFYIGELHEAKKYCELFIKKHEVEDAYISNLKYCFITKDRSKFDYYFEKLQKSPIDISNDGLKVIRFWMKG